MDVMHMISIISLDLLFAWIGALLLGVCSQGVHAYRSWVNDDSSPVPRNPVLVRVLDFFALNHGDRLSHSLIITCSIIAWPIGLVIFFPALLMLRAKKRKREERPSLTNDEPPHLFDDKLAGQPSKTASMREAISS